MVFLLAMVHIFLFLSMCSNFLLTLHWGVLNFVVSSKACKLFCEVVVALGIMLSLLSLVIRLVCVRLV